jgi:hypothetical protein
MVFEGRFQADKFISFCERLIKHSRGKVFLIVDGHPAYRVKLVKHWLNVLERRFDGWRVNPSLGLLISATSPPAIGWLYLACVMDTFGGRLQGTSRC